jgi:hypothetical protein
MISEVNFDYRFFGHGKEDCDNALMMLGTTWDKDIHLIRFVLHCSRWKCEIPEIEWTLCISERSATFYGFSGGSKDTRWFMSRSELTKYLSWRRPWQGWPDTQITNVFMFSGISFGDASDPTEFSADDRINLLLCHGDFLWVARQRLQQWHWAKKRMLSFQIFYIAAVPNPTSRLMDWFSSTRNISVSSRRSWGRPNQQRQQSDRESRDVCLLTCHGLIEWKTESSGRQYNPGQRRSLRCSDGEQTRHDGNYIARTITQKNGPSCNRRFFFRSICHVRKLWKTKSVVKECSTALRSKWTV